ncbi:cuticle protein 14-like [Limulus polyphemus]|uniref:Cuticle protein 14-like n=1 Tax=Limulus polyphemus TaxID=6850 RepID=A0ABM1SZF8_LIMPO|nr:cuticle protein 14-like [Limulus polyphemus]
MKLLILFALAVSSQATFFTFPYYYHPYYYHGLGTSIQHRSQDSLGNYNFGYDEDHLTGGSFRRESGDGLSNVKIGSYGLKDADGSIRIVDYVADSNGFRAKIRTSGDVPEKNPADVEISKADVVEVKPVEVKPAIQYITPYFYNWASPYYGWTYPFYNWAHPYYSHYW